MKAVVLRELGEPDRLRLEDFPDPQPGPHEVLIRLKAAALNHRDVWIRRGLYAGIRLPIILGSDGSGDVVAVGDHVPASLIGKSIVILPSLDWGENDQAPGPAFRILGLPDNGTYAQFIKVPAANAFLKPDSLSYEQGAALALAGLTAFRSLVTRAAVQHRETVVITGIGGGVACFALQIAVWLGAEVFVTSGSDEKLERARSLGASGGANHKTEDWAVKIRSLNQGRQPDVIVDSIGGDIFSKALELVRPGGRIITYGATTGPANQFEIRRVFWKQLNLLGSTMGNAKEFQAVLDLYGSHRLRPVIDQIFSLSETAAAHRRMEAAEQLGKIVLRMD
jgi:zinc-binding alcohol dehydrogenase/oxidoreductase